MYIIVTCVDLPDIYNGHEVSYTPPRSVSPNLPVGKRYTGTIATYNCLSGCQLVGGSSLRACGADGEWNGTASSCGKFCESSHVQLARYNLCLLKHMVHQFCITT